MRNLCLIAVAVVLSACSAPATPALIGAYPLGTEVHYPKPPEELVVVYDTTINLAVGDVAWAARPASDAAYRYGGYVTVTQTWYEGEQRHTTLTLPAPAPNYEALRGDVLSLGRLIS